MLMLIGAPQLLDDCTARMKMHTFAGKLFTPAGDIIQSGYRCSLVVADSTCLAAAVLMRLLFRAELEDVEPKSHLIVVAEKEAFKVRAMMQPDEEDEPPQTSSTGPSSDQRAVTPPRARPADRSAPTEAPSPAPAPTLALSPAASVAEAPAPSATMRDE